jgi:LysM repeat protein
MRRTQRNVLLSTVGLLIVLSLVVGCRPQVKALPDLKETPTSESTPSTSDIQKTAMANSATAQAAAGGAVDTADGTPTASPPLPTTLPTPIPLTTAPATAVSTAAPAPTAASPSSTAGGEVTYVVQRGDTLYSIARRYGTTVQAIAVRNGIANPSLIRVGQTLTIPTSGTSTTLPSGGTTYVVQPGDNLFRIALRYNMSHVYLAQYNGITDPSRIYVGQVIRIPPH